jgi:hypothetical protein
MAIHLNGDANCSGAKSVGLTLLNYAGFLTNELDFAFRENAAGLERLLSMSLFHRRISPKQLSTATLRLES